MTLAHDVQGSGPPLLLIHGGTLDRRMWEPNMAALTERHRVVRCDLRGYGASPPPDGPYSHADDVRALLATLGIERAAVAHARDGDLDAAREVWLATPIFAHSPAGVAAALRAIVDDYTFWHWSNPNPHVRLEPPAGGRGAEVGAPTLVVWGEHDADQVIGNCERIARDIPDARTVVIEGAGHMSNMDAPAAFDAALLGFLAGVAA